MNNIKKVKIFIPNDEGLIFLNKYIEYTNIYNNTNFETLDYTKSFLSNSIHIKIDNFIKELSDVFSFSYLESSYSEFPFWLIYIPNYSNWKNILGLDFWKIWTMWNYMESDFPRIYSNWQLNEYKTEKYLLETVDSGWYFYLRNTIKEFLNLSLEEQLECIEYKNLINLLKKHFYESNIESNPNIINYYACLCFDAIFAQSRLDLPLLAWFIRTSTLYSDGSVLWVLWSSYWVDIDWFWSWNWWASNASLGFCFKI